MSAITYIKKSGVSSFIHKFSDSIFYKIRDKIFKIRAEKRWREFVSVDEAGTVEKQRKNRLIVSLTSFPARINTVEITIKSLLVQTVKPDIIILWLGEDKFENKEESLPKSLLALKKYGLTIGWCKDLGSYTKLVPTLKNFPNDIVITVDDDIIYHHRLVEKLYYAYLKEPQYIHCNRVTKYYINKQGKYEFIGGGWDYYKEPSYLQKQTGVGGVIYPPNSLYKDCTDETIFRTIAHLNDDAWFWLMGVLKGYKVNVVQKPQLVLHYVGRTQEGPSQFQINDDFIWPEFYNIMERYPELHEILSEENRVLRKR